MQTAITCSRRGERMRLVAYADARDLGAFLRWRGLIPEVALTAGRAGQYRVDPRSGGDWISIFSNQSAPEAGSRQCRAAEALA